MKISNGRPRGDDLEDFGKTDVHSSKVGLDKSTGGQADCPPGKGLAQQHPPQPVRSTARLKVKEVI